MAIKYIVGGVATSVPGVFSTLSVANSLPAAAPAGRSVFIFGESEEGLPGSELDLKLNYFLNFDAVKEYYKSGSIVDAARMLFSSPPSPVFSGSLDRLYVYKTNNSTRAERSISSPSGYGDLVAYKFGEAGNLIKTKITTSQSESKPSKSFKYLPSSLAKDLTVMANGVKSSVVLSADDVGSDVQGDLHALTGVACSGGSVKVDVTGAMNVLLSAASDILTISKDSGVGIFGADIAVGDIAYISPASLLAGALDENSGAYEVVSASASSLSLKQLKRVTATGEANHVAFDLSPVSILAAGEIKINSSLVVSVDASTISGSGASLEILEENAGYDGIGLLYPDSFSNLLTNATSTVASISSSVPAVGQLKVTLSQGAWSYIPKAGDVVKIGKSSVLAGATFKNVGSFVVVSANSQNITMNHLYSGMTTEVVSSVLLNGANNTLEFALGFVSSSVSAKRIDSSFERKVKLAASRESDGVNLADNSIGGNVVLEIGFYDVAATACTLSIDPQRILTISPVGSGLSDIVVNTRKYSSLQELVDFLNTRSGVSAKVPNPQMKSLPTNLLDMISSVPCLSGQSVSAYNGRIKKDYKDWMAFIEGNTGLVAFREGSMSLKVGLPDAESNFIFLDGATLGATSNADCQAALDAALKVDVRQVVALFSRDASKDITDGLTDSGSSYTIDSINAAKRAHISTASGILFQKERQACLSFYGSFADSKLAAGEVASELANISFQLFNATDGNGTLKRFLPWMGACAIASARVRAPLSTSMLRKPMLLSSADHLGDVSLYSDSLVPDFDVEDRNQLEEAIDAGLTCFRAVSGFGVRMESPDVSSRSRLNDPQAWTWERQQVVFCLHEVIATLRSVLDSYVGNRQSESSPAVVKQALKNALSGFLPGTGNSALVAAQIIDVQRVGVQYNCKIQVRPDEALEAIDISVLATREIE